LKDALELRIHGIKCDVCDYREERNGDKLTLEDCKQYLNKPCPKCGANLLTREDYDSIAAFMGGMNALNKILPPVDDNMQREVSNVEMNGTGDMKFKFIGKEVIN
jgi:hypothetical protein